MYPKSRKTRILGPRSSGPVVQWSSGHFVRFHSFQRHSVTDLQPLQRMAVQATQAMHTTHTTNKDRKSAKLP